jgi:hypothetical protein
VSNTFVVILIINSKLKTDTIPLGTREISLSKSHFVIYFTYILNRN